MTPSFVFDTKAAVGLLPGGNDACKNIRIYEWLWNEAEDLRTKLNTCIGRTVRTTASLVRDVIYDFREKERVGD